MKFPLLLALGLTLSLGAAAPEQKSPPVAPADASMPLLVWDVAPDLRAGLPRNFRTTDDLGRQAHGPGLVDTGLAALHASGGAQFTPAGLKLMLEKIPGLVTVIDLRQEDHGFINAEPVSWMASRNWGNVGRTREEILADEQRRLAAFPPGTTVAVADDKAKKGTAGATANEVLTVAQASTEADVVRAAGAAYVRIPVTDHSRPLDAEVDRFIATVRALPADGWVHFHCRAGKGRTTTFLALYDMPRNAGQVSLTDIVERQSKLVGDYNLLAKEEESGWKAGVGADRAAFVRAFYDYARANPGGRPLLWSEWLAKP